MNIRYIGSVDINRERVHIVHTAQGLEPVFATPTMTTFRGVKVFYANNVRVEVACPVEAVVAAIEAARVVKASQETGL